MALCDACKNITIDALRQSTGYKHLSTVQSLPVSAKSCRLCNLILLALLQNTERTEEGFVESMDKMFGPALDPVPISMHGAPSAEEGQQLPCSLTSIDVYVPTLFGDGFVDDIVKLNIFVLPGNTTQAFEGISGRPPLADTGSDEAFSLLNHWLDACRENHKACSNTILGTGDAQISTTLPRLPTRVVDVGPTDGSQEPRLFITEGATGKYATLSHCWGKIRFLTTTTESIKKYTTCIPFKKLTKTFQDAIIITRKLGLQYIWIDSLCIIQNDREDWERESTTMGLIYQCSEITIAASAAVDGSVGCFIPRPNPPEPVELPNILPRTEATVDSAFVMLYPDEKDGNPELMPLNDRAWVTQEWLLSRRMVHYTTNRMIWSCKTLIESEDGEVIPEGDPQRVFRGIMTSGTHSAKQGQYGDESPTTFHSDWCDIISSYSSRQLTYNTDKLIALQGLVEEIKKMTHKEYHAGIWACDIPMQLFWVAKSSLTRPEPLRRSPSWSWASTMGALTYHVPARSGRLVVKDATIEGSALHVTGPLKRIPRFSSMPLSLSGPSPELRQLHLFVSASTFSSGAFILPTLFFAFGDTENEKLGWVSFDEGKVPEDGCTYGVPISKNVMNGQDDGYNVLFLRELGVSQSERGFRRFVRVGVGEVVVNGWFDVNPMEGLEVV